MINKLIKRKHNIVKLNDFIPLVGHVDKDLLLTREGEIVVCLKIEDSIDLNGKIQINNILHEIFYQQENIHNFSIQLHLVRKERNIVELTYSQEEILKRPILNQTLKKYEENDILWNNLYIVITHYGIRSLFGKSIKTSAELFKGNTILVNLFEDIHKEIQEFSNIILDKLKEYNARKMVMNDNYESEPLSFLKYLWTSRLETFKVNEYDIIFDEIIEIEEEENYAVIYSPNKENIYVSMINFKYPYSINVENKNILLDINDEVLITEKIIFPQNFKTYKKYLDTLNKTQTISPQKSPILNMTTAALTEIEKYNKCALSQITITLFDKSKELIDIRTGKINSIISSMKMNTLNEDIYNTACFLSNLPGNTKYIARNSFIPISNSCAWANFISTQKGNYRGTKLGSPVLILHNEINNQPFFFNIFVENSIKNLLIVNSLKENNCKHINSLIQEYIEYHGFREIKLEITTIKSKNIKTLKTYKEAMEWLKIIFSHKELINIWNLLLMYDDDKKDGKGAIKGELMEILTGETNATEDDLQKKFLELESYCKQLPIYDIREYIDYIELESQNISDTMNKQLSTIVLKIPEKVIDNKIIVYFFIYKTLSKIAEITSEQNNNTKKDDTKKLTILKLNSIDEFIFDGRIDEISRRVIGEINNANICIITELKDRDSAHRSTHGKTPILNTFYTKIIFGDITFSKKYKNQFQIDDELIDIIRNTGGENPKFILLQNKNFIISKSQLS